MTLRPQRRGGEGPAALPQHVEVPPRGAPVREGPGAEVVELDDLDAPVGQEPLRRRPGAALRGDDRGGRHRVPEGRVQGQVERAGHADAQRGVAGRGRGDWASRAVPPLSRLKEEGPPHLPVGQPRVVPPDRVPAHDHGVGPRPRGKHPARATPGRRPRPRALRSSRSCRRASSRT